jgi:hypothetical protein
MVPQENVFTIRKEPVRRDESLPPPPPTMRYIPLHNSFRYTITDFSTSISLIFYLKLSEDRD